MEFATAQAAHPDQTAAELLGSSTAAAVDEPSVTAARTAMLARLEDAGELHDGRLEGPGIAAAAQRRTVRRAGA
ncbi:hypothetical protein ABZ208_30760 [Streptomyces sp. NPDC006208]|uniref:hypothetical protein n=1 Tax=Streptomyces sp. NPDC006208 TaxID=3156734 RepID=UPI00339F578B